MNAFRNPIGRTAGGVLLRNDCGAWRMAEPKNFAKNIVVCDRFRSSASRKGLENFKVDFNGMHNKFQRYRLNYYSTIYLVLQTPPNLTSQQNIFDGPSFSAKRLLLYMPKESSRLYGMQSQLNRRSVDDT